MAPGFLAVLIFKCYLFYGNITAIIIDFGQFILAGLVRAQTRCSYGKVQPCTFLTEPGLHDTLASVEAVPVNDLPVNSWKRDSHYIRVHRQG